MDLVAHLEKLRVFEAVVKTGSIRKAAAELRLSQPAVTRSIAALETALECRLFFREVSGVTPTRQGTELYAFTERLLREAQQIPHRLHHGDETLESSFVIGTYDSIAVYFFPTFLRQVQRTQKNLHINLHTASSRQLSKDLRTGKIDIAVSVNPEPARHVVSHELYRDFYAIYSRSRTRPRGKTTFALMPEAMDLQGKTLASYAHGFGFSEEETLRCSNFETVRALLEEGVGIGILPTRVAEKAVRSGALSRVEFPHLPAVFGEHVIGFSYMRGREGDSAVGWLLRELTHFLSPRLMAS